MAEFIDKQLAIKQIKAVPPGNWSAKRYADELEEMPAADVAPIVHSRWELHGDGSGTCQHCHRTQTAVWDFEGWQRFCGDCGAKMDEEN